MTDQKTISDFITKSLLNGKEGVNIGPDDSLLLSGLVDSLGIMQLVKYVEEANGIKIAPGEITLKNFKTINSIVQFVERKQSN